MMRSHLLVVLPLFGLGALAGCSSNDTAPTIIPVQSSGGTSTGGQSNTGTAGNGSGSGGDGTTAGSGGSTGASGSVAMGGAGGTTDPGSNDGGPASGMSTGCGKPWAHATGVWVEVAGPASHTNPAPLEPLWSVVGPPGGFTENRGYWVFIPKNYDPSKAYKVIYSGAGCDDPDRFNAGKDGYPYQTVDKDDAIQVGLDYDEHSFTPLCYDNRNPLSNDFVFMPKLMDRIASDFCVDLGHQFFSGYSSGGWVAQQFNCAFPARLRGLVSVTGSEPMGGLGAQPTCNPAPTALMHIHDIADSGNTYGSFLPGCTRVLKQNKCEVTDCSQPESMTLTSAYTLPAGIPVPPSTVCRKFNGCPADYPVVFCTTHLPSTANRHGDQREWAIPAFWDFMSNLK